MLTCLLASLTVARPQQAWTQQSMANDSAYPQVLFGQGQKAMSEGRFSDALGFFTDVAKLMPGYPGLYEDIQRCAGGIKTELQRNQVDSILRGAHALEKEKSQILSLLSSKAVHFNLKEGRGEGFLVQPEVLFDPTHPASDLNAGADQILLLIAKYSQLLASDDLIYIKLFGPDGGQNSRVRMTQEVALSNRLHTMGADRRNLVFGDPGFSLNPPIPDGSQGYIKFALIPVKLNPIQTVADYSRQREGSLDYLRLYLGADRPEFTPQNGEKVEFHLVINSPVKLRGWEFAIYDRDDEPVAAIHGTDLIDQFWPWSGTNDSQTRPLSPGEYRCVLTATDALGQFGMQRQFIKIMPSAKRPEPAKVLTVVLADAKHHESSSRKSMKTVEVQSDPQPRNELKLDTFMVTKMLFFESGESQISGEMEFTLEPIVKTLKFFANNRLRVEGIALSSEPQPEALAKRRAEAVKMLLGGKEYQIDPSRVLLKATIDKSSGPESKPRAEISVY